MLLFDELVLVCVVERDLLVISQPQKWFLWLFWRVVDDVVVGWVDSEDTA